jgi:hypothetical protein
MAASFEEFTETELARLDAERIEDDKLRAGQLRRAPEAALVVTRVGPEVLD